jgi:hypothetical protein
VPARRLLGGPYATVATTALVCCSGRSRAADSTSARSRSQHGAARSIMGRATARCGAIAAGSLRWARRTRPAASCPAPRHRPRVRSPRFVDPVASGGWPARVHDRTLGLRGRPSPAVGHAGSRRACCCRVLTDYPVVPFPHPPRAPARILVRSAEPIRERSTGSAASHSSPDNSIAVLGRRAAAPASHGDRGGIGLASPRSGNTLPLRLRSRSRRSWGGCRPGPGSATAKPGRRPGPTGSRSAARAP